MMLTGRRQTPAGDYPQIGAVAAKALTPADSALPGHILITPGGGGGRGNDSAYLGPKYASIDLGNGNPPQNTTRPENIAEASDAARQDFRRTVNERFLNRRRTAVTDAFAYSYEQARAAHAAARRVRRDQGTGERPGTLRQARLRTPLSAGAAICWNRA